MKLFTTKRVVRQGLIVLVGCVVASCSWLPRAWGIELPYGGMNAAPYAYYGTALPFADVAHMGDKWSSVPIAGGAWSTPRSISVNADGYPTALAPDEVAQSLVFTHNGGIYPTGIYNIMWAGSGEVRLNAPDATLISSTPGFVRYRVTDTNPNGLMLEIVRTDPANPVRALTMHAPMGNSSGTTINPQYIKDLSYYGVMRLMDWNQTNNSTVSRWADRTTASDFHWAAGGGVPYEAQIRLSNESKKDLWITVPHLADNDYVRNLARLVQQGLSSDLRVWVEYSNEVWNGSFEQSRYANDVLRPQYGLPNAAQAYGRRSAEIFDIFSSEIPNANRLVRVIAGQTANYGILEQSLIGATINGTLKADVAAIAPYFTVDIDQLHESFSNNTVDLSAVFAEMRASIDSLMGQVVHNRTIASARGLPLVSYEGGQHLVVNPGEDHNDLAFIDFVNSLNRDPRMGQMYTRLLDQWYAAGGKTFTFYNDIGPWSKWGAWGLQEDYLDEDSVKFRAVQDYLKRFQTSATGQGTDAYSVWRATFGSTTLLDADVNRDGVVNAADYVVLRKYLDSLKLNSLLSSSASLPEPGGLLLIMTGAMATGPLGVRTSIVSRRQPWKRIRASDVEQVEFRAAGSRTGR